MITTLVWIIAFIAGIALVNVVVEFLYHIETPKDLTLWLPSIHDAAADPA